jgi:hypothetical protein
MFERRLYYLQARVDAVPPAVSARSSTSAADPARAGRVFRLLGGTRRSAPATGGAR